MYHQFHLPRLKKNIIAEIIYLINAFEFTGVPIKTAIKFSRMDFIITAVQSSSLLT